MTGGDRAIRYSTIGAVSLVAGIAGWVSYIHAYDVIRAHGEAGLVGRVYPGTVDGLIYCASMVLLDSARRGITAPVIARWLLAAGIGATLLANVLAGLSWGPLGAVVAAWPALALVGSYELLMLIIRGSAREDRQPPADVLPSPSFTDAQTAAREALARSVVGGNPLSQNQLQAQFRLSRAEATRVRQAVLAESNGHVSPD